MIDKKSGKKILLRERSHSEYSVEMFVSDERTKTRGSITRVTTYRKLGTVRRFERRYNLRRVIVLRGWRATLYSGAKLYRGDTGTTADTRREAISILIEHALREST